MTQGGESQTSPNTSPFVIECKSKWNRLFISDNDKNCQCTGVWQIPSDLWAFFYLLGRSNKQFQRHLIILKLRIFLTQPLRCGITRLAFLYISCLFWCFDKIQLGSLGWPGSLHKSQVGFALMRTSCLGFHWARLQVSLFLHSLVGEPCLTWTKPWIWFPALERGRVRSCWIFLFLLIQLFLFLSPSSFN